MGWGFSFVCGLFVPDDRVVRVQFETRLPRSIVLSLVDLDFEFVRRLRR